MAPKLGWIANEKRSSIWKGDEALDLEDADASVLAAWGEDGEAHHLEPFVKKGQPSRIEWRTLNGDELRFARGPGYLASSIGGAIDRIWRLAFRIGFRYVDMEAEVLDSKGLRHQTVVREEGIHMLTGGVTDYIEKTNPGIVDFYGALIFGASVPTVAEKKASSPLSTRTPSSEAATSTPDTTEPPPAEPGA